MREVLLRRTPVELSDDVRFAGRVRRLALTAVVALGVLWALAAVALDVPPLVNTSLAAGWLLMPLILFASLSRPVMRYALVVPATLVSLPLLAISFLFLPAHPIAAAGWLLVTAGILMGGVLGTWFWFRLLPVPAALADPFAPGRLAAIGVHVALICIGLSLVLLELLARIV
jgi:hypothetical protein